MRKIILENKPEIIVECGAGNGETTKLISHMQLFYPFEFYVISDKVVPGLSSEIEWKIGLSYNKLKEFEDNSIGMCIIDTDHNYWTLNQELEAVKDKMKEGGLIVFHDVEEFYHNTGMAMSYWNEEHYPEKEIMDCAKLGGVADALLNFLVIYKDQYKLNYWMKESHGAAVIEKKTITLTQIIRPAGNPPFAKPVAEFSG